MTLLEATQLATLLDGKVEFIEELGYHTVVTDLTVPEISEILQQHGVENYLHASDLETK